MTLAMGDTNLHFDDPQLSGHFSCGLVQMDLWLPAISIQHFDIRPLDPFGPTGP